MITLSFLSPSTDINSLPSVYVRPVLKTDEMSRPETSEKKETSKDSESKGGEKEYERTVYDCPVFMNRARQVCAFVLPLSTEGSPDRWTRAGTAVILDSGQFYYGLFYNFMHQPLLLLLKNIVNVIITKWITALDDL